MNAIQISNVSIRQVNGLYSLNDLHRASGGEDKNAPRRWLQNQQTIDLIEQCEIDGFPSILVKQGVGTFACKELICAYATWISPTFFLQVIRTFLAVQEQGSLKLETRDVALSAQDVRRLSALFRHLPFMLAYAKETQTAVYSLKPELVFRTHDRFQDGYIAARQLADSLGLPMRSWRDVQLDMFR